MELSDRQHTLETEIHKTLQRDPNSEYNNSINSLLEITIDKTVRQQIEEDAMIEEYVQLVEQRNRLVLTLEDDRIR